MAIAEYNKIDVENDSKTVIQSKIDAMKEAVRNGDMTQGEYDAEKERVETSMTLKKRLFGYAFTW